MAGNSKPSVSDLGVEGQINIIESVIEGGIDVLTNDNTNDMILINTNGYIIFEIPQKSNIWATATYYGDGGGGNAKSINVYKKSNQGTYDFLLTTPTTNDAQWYKLLKELDAGTYKITLVNNDRYVTFNEWYIEEIETVSDIPNVSHKNASLIYTLPMDTTQGIVTKSNDSREGLLGMANDAENYGDLYVVGNDGKAHLTKSGIKSEVLFEGSAKSENVVTLKKSIKDFKEIIVYANPCTGDSIRSIAIQVDDNIISASALKYMISGYYTAQHNYSIRFCFNSEKELTVGVAPCVGWVSVEIHKVIGVY